MPNRFRNYSSEARQEHDYYATHPSAVYPLFDVEDFTSTIIEPACGEGHMARAIQECGHEVIASDIVDRGYGGAADFLSFEPVSHDIVTNPPYSLQSEFVEKAMGIPRPGGKLALLLKIQFLETAKREDLFKRFPPKRIHVFSRRAKTAKNGDFDHTGLLPTLRATYPRQDQGVCVMACDFCDGITCLKTGSIELRLVDNVLHIEATAPDFWYSMSEDFEVRNCLLCGEDLGGDE